MTRALRGKTLDYQYLNLIDMILDYKKYQPTGIRSIDLVTRVIYGERLRNMPLKAIHLSPTHFEHYKSGVNVLLEKERGHGLLVGEGMQFDGVNIERGDFGQLHEYQLEYYPMATPSLN